MTADAVALDLGDRVNPCDASPRLAKKPYMLSDTECRLI